MTVVVDCDTVIAWYHKDFPDTVEGRTSPMPKELAVSMADDYNLLFPDYRHTTEPYVHLYQTKTKE